MTFSYIINKTHPNQEINNDRTLTSNLQTPIQIRDWEQISSDLISINPIAPDSTFPGVMEFIGKLLVNWTLPQVAGLIPNLTDTLWEI